MSRDPHNPFDERAVGTAMLGTVFFFVVTGLGVGAFIQSPIIGGLGGGVLGIAIGVILVPPLMRHWRD